MEKEKQTRVYNYLKKYIDQKINHDGYINYYEMYNLDKDMSIEEINKKIESQELKTLFDEKNVDTIEPCLKPIFLETSKEVNNMIHFFSDEEVKKMYDYYLNSKTNDCIGLDDSQKLDIVVKTSIDKYGFYHGFASLQALIKYQRYDVITKENNDRNIVKQLSEDKINKVIYEKRSNIMDDNQDNMIMDYFSKFIKDGELKEKADTFYNACHNTVEKYDSNGINQLNYAVEGMINNSSAERFTNLKNSRDNLKNSKLNCDDCYVLMLMKIHSKKNENESYAYSNIVGKSQKEKISLFSEIIKEESQKGDFHQKNTVK